MNIVDLVIIAMIAVTVISGMYRGFISSLMSTANLFISWLAAYTVYPTITANLLGNSQVMDTLYYYTDAASKLGTGVARTSVGQITDQMLQSAISSISLPAPFDELLRQNVNSQAFSSLNLSTLGDYVNQTICSVVMNVGCFLLVFIVCFIVINLLVNLLNYMFKFPVISHGDALLGGAMGFLRGYFFVYLLFTLVPILLTAIPVQMISDYINASKLGAHFLGTNFITSIIKATM